MYLAILIIVNIFGTLGYAEEEFWSGVLKLGATVVFIICSVVFVCGKGPAGKLPPTSSPTATIGGQQFPPN